jgi:hypothetical protein
MPQMSTWKKTVKALVSTVPREAGSLRQGKLPEAGPESERGSEGGTQPSGGAETNAAAKRRSASPATPVSVRMTSGRMRKISGTGFTAGPPHH